MRYPKLKNPSVLSAHYLPDSGPEKILQMYRSGKLPESIAGFMIATSAKRMLRGVYGSNLRAGIAIVCDAVRENIAEFFYPMLRWTPRNRALEKEFNKMDEEFDDSELRRDASQN